MTHQRDQLLNQRRRGLYYEIDMIGWDDDEDKYDKDFKLQSSTHEQPSQLDSIDFAEVDLH